MGNDSGTQSANPRWLQRFCQAAGSSLQILAQGLADFPMMAERINDSSDAPAVGLVADLRNDCRPGCDSPFKNGIRVFHDQYHAHRAAAERFGTEIGVTRRLVSEPKLGAA